MTDLVLSPWLGVPVLLTTMTLLALWEIGLLRDRPPGLLLRGSAVCLAAALVTLVILRFAEFA